MNIGVTYMAHPNFYHLLRWPRCCNLHYWAPPPLLMLPKPEESA